MYQKNILFFADRLPPLIGGMEMHAKYFIEYFNEHKDFPISVIITKNNEGENVLEEVKDILTLSHKNQKIAIDELNKYVNPEIIFFNSGRWIEEMTEIRNIFPKATFLYRTGGNEILKAPLIENNISIHKLRQSYWVNTINNNIDILITNSLYTEQRLRKLGVNVSFQRFVGGVDVNDFQKFSPSKHSQNETITIFCAARFVPYKNHLLMISIINELVLRGLKLKVKLAGDGPLLTLVQKKIEQYNLKQVIELLGVLDNSQVCQEIFNADIYMQLSSDVTTKVAGGSYVHAEGMGRSILEAISLGTFVIAGKSGALSEVVKLPYGLLINTNATSIEEIADNITPIIKNPPAKMNIKTKFDWKNIFRAYEKLFKNI